MLSDEMVAIKGVRPLGANHDFTEIKQPKMTWELEDLSSNGAGRTEDNTMQKKRSGQVEKLSLSWTRLKTSELAKLLQVFNPEYVEVIYFCPLLGEYKTAVFYTGNRKAVPMNYKHGVWQTLSFSITTRGGSTTNVPNYNK